MGTAREEWEAAKADRNRVKEALDAAKARVAARFAELVFEEHGVAPGAIVESRGKQYVVVSTEVRDYDPAKYQPWLQGCAIKKDGTPGSRQMTIYQGWKLVRPVS